MKMNLMLLLALAAAPTLWSQVVGASLSGTVRDETGAALPAAVVSVKSLETGFERKLVTDDGGRYSAPSIAVGRYLVSAEKPGFTSQRKTGIDLVVGQTTVVDLTLPVGEFKQVVTVEAGASPVNQSTQQISGLVDERQIKYLPLNGRSYDQLVALNPGIVNYTAERTGGVGTSNSSVGNMFAVSGRRPQENLFLLNGVEFTGASLIDNTPGGASGQLLGVDAVREFNVVSGTYGAEYGKRPGAQISIVTASGSNGLHGTLYEFLRNSALDARNFFDQGSIPQFQRNTFGGTLGGPLKKNKLFLFGNYEGFRQHLGVSAVTLVPDNNARAGRPGTGQRRRRGVQPPLADHPRGFRHHPPGLQHRAKRHPIRRLYRGRQLREHAIRQSAEFRPGRTARAGGQSPGTARFLAEHAQHRTRGLLARQLLLHRRDARRPARMGLRRPHRRRGDWRRHRAQRGLFHHRSRLQRG